MKTLNTNAKNAKDEVYKILSSENHVYRAWQLIDYKIDPLRLKVTDSEIVNYLQVDAFVRPGFTVTVDTATLPHLFVKIDGYYSGVVESLKQIHEVKPEKVTMIDKVELVNKKPITTFLKTKPTWYDDEAGINIDLALKENFNSLLKLKPSYRENYLEAINRVIEKVNNGAMLVKKPTSRVILETLIYNNSAVVEMYHDYDYQYMVPKFMVKIAAGKSVNVYAVLRMMLMNELGFDVVVLDELGYSTIENILSADEFDVHTIREADSQTDIPFKEKRQKRDVKSKMKMTGIFLTIVMVLAFCGLGYLIVENGIEYIIDFFNTVIINPIYSFISSLL